MWLGAAVAGVGSTMTLVAVGLHVYELTESTFAVGMLGTVALVPMILAGIYGGMITDAVDRRLVALASAIAAWASTAGIALVAWLELDQVWLLYVLTTLNSVATTIISTARTAIVPRLLPPRLLPAASALTGISSGLTITLGPALAGVLVAGFGFAWTYTADVLLFTAAFVGLATLPAVVPEGERRRPGMESVREGLQFLRHAPNIRMSFIVDIVAMTFGRPHALFPAVGALVIGGGAVTVGVLTAAVAVGALVCSVLSGKAGTVRRHGVAIGWSIAAYGASIAAFGIVLAMAPGTPSTDFAQVDVVALVAATIALAASGAADNVSAIFRVTMMQVAVPDGVRGRLQGIFTVVVTGGPRVGDFYVGVTAAIAALWVPPVLGGLLIIGLIGVCMRLGRSFREYDALDPKP